MTLRQVIEQEITLKGPIPFSRYMELCLYHPELGYYSRNVEQFGKAGDFFTSSDVHAVFGRLLARQFEEIWRALGSPKSLEVLELGPGRGLFARDVLDWSEKKFPKFFNSLHYSLAEQSPSLKERLKQNLKTHLQSGRASIIAPEIKRALTSDVPLIIFANEVFDAIPVEVLSNQGKLCVSYKNVRFEEMWVPASDGELKFLQDYSVEPVPHECLEVAVGASNLMAQIANTIQTGVFLTLDYGYTQREQQAGRHRGTLKAIRQHSVSASPYEAPGEQDITANVNFTALTAVAEQNGMTVQPLRTQSQFLMGIGEKNQFADAFEDCRVPQERAKVALQLKHLVTPAGLGESFQVMVASKGVDAEIVPKLSGLSFGNHNG
ncbi:MAG TPA: SAM-dependent methyltransferase [Terriglobales bacterium]|nr:SAM-dependent methyltransferase [Terriglobales bacterium]